MAAENAANWRNYCPCSGLHRDCRRPAGDFGRSVSGPLNSVSWEDGLETGSKMCRLWRGKSEHAVLARPFRREFAKARDTHSIGQAAFNSRLDQVGCKKGKRDRHVDLAYAAPLSLSDRVNSNHWLGLELIQPPSSLGN